MHENDTTLELWGHYLFPDINMRELLLWDIITPGVFLAFINLLVLSIQINKKLT